MRRAALLLNPRAGQRGSGRATRALERVARELERAFELEVVPTTGPAHCRDLARRAVADRLDALFALGGDGTLRVLAGVLAGTEVALGPLPGGTTNVVAGALGLPRDPVAAARALARGEPRALDVGRCGTGAFLMQVSGGLDATVMAAVDPALKQRFGKLADRPRRPARVAPLPLPGALSRGRRPRRRRVTGFVVANLAQYAGSFEIVPGARGRRPSARAAALARPPPARRPRLRDRPGARPPHRAAGRRGAPRQRVRLLAPDPLRLQGDGDPFRDEPPLELRLGAERLRVLAPAG